MVIAIKRSGEDIYDTKRAQEVADERVSKLEEAVAKNKGEIVLLHRNIYGGSGDRGCFGGGILQYLYTFDAGIISGDLKKVDFRASEMKSVRDIPSPDFFHAGRDYYYHAEIMLPVERKFSARGILHFNVDNLNQVSKGDIEFERGELLPEFLPVGIPGYTRTSPFLTGFGIFIGDKEIAEFVETDPFKILGAGFAGDTKKTLSEFFKLIRDPSEAKRIIGADLFRKKSDLTSSLLESVVGLSGFDSQLSRIKEKVMDIDFYYAHDQDGRDLVVTNDELYGHYIRLRGEVNASITGVEKILRESDALGLNTEPFKISGVSIGFPAESDSQRYISFVNTELIPKVKKNLKEMDEHLKDKEKRAK